MIQRTLIVVALAATSLVCAVPAVADEDEYVRTMHEKYVYVTTRELRAEGAKVCAAARGGMASPQATDMVSRDLVVQATVAADIVATAIVQLGC